MEQAAFRVCCCRFVYDTTFQHDWLPCCSQLSVKCQHNSHKLTVSKRYVVLSAMYCYCSVYQASSSSGRS